MSEKNLSVITCYTYFKRTAKYRILLHNKGHRNKAIGNSKVWYETDSSSISSQKFFLQQESFATCMQFCAEYMYVVSGYIQKVIQSAWFDCWAILHVNARVLYIICMLL